MIDPSCYEGSVKREEFCIQIFTPSKSCAAMVENGDVLLLRGITNQPCLKNPEKNEFLFRSDTDNIMVVFPNGQRDLVRVGSGTGPVPQNITLGNLRNVESLSNWHKSIKIVSGTPTVSSHLLCFMLNFHHTFSISNSQLSHQPSLLQLTGP